VLAESGQHVQTKNVLRCSAAVRLNDFSRPPAMDVAMRRIVVARKFLFQTGKPRNGSGSVDRNVQAGPLGAKPLHRHRTLKHSNKTKYIAHELLCRRRK
jgi:hypothetical protein